MSRLIIKRWPDGKYLVSYDPDWQPDPLPAGDPPWRCGVSEWTINPDKAMIFHSMTEAMDFWNQQSSTHPLRGDGKPNRPLTSYSVEVIPAPPIPGEDDASPTATETQ